MKVHAVDKVCESKHDRIMQTAEHTKGNKHQSLLGSVVLAPLSHSKMVLG